MKWHQPWPFEPSIHLDKSCDPSMKEPTFAWMKLKVKCSLSLPNDAWGWIKNNNVINVALGKTKIH